MLLRRKFYRDPCSLLLRWILIRTVVYVAFPKKQSLYPVTESLPGRSELDLNAAFRKDIHAILRGFPDALQLGLYGFRPYILCQR